MNNITRVSIDLAKNIFQICAVDQHQNVVFNKAVSRAKLQTIAAQLPATSIYIEACYSSHYWGRYLTALGHKVFLIPAQHVKPFLRGGKNDKNDALAIIEAASRPNLRFVPIKTITQQEVASLHKIREGLVARRTAVSNQARGLVTDFGLIYPKGFKAFHMLMAHVQDHDQLSAAFKLSMQDVYTEFNALTERIERIDKEISQQNHQSNEAMLIQTIPGIGNITASAIIAHIDKGQAFHNPKSFAVWLGLTPSQTGSGGKFINGRITKRGNTYLRTLLVHAARACKRSARGRKDKLSLWIQQLEARVGKHKATVAIAHRLARLVWILIQKQTPFKYQYGLAVTSPLDSM